MNSALKCWLVVLAAASVATAWAGEQPSTVLNLQDINPQDFTVLVKRVNLFVNGHAPEILAFTNRQPSRLAHRVDPDLQKVRVTYGADLIGFARVQVSRPGVKGKFTFVSLDFESADQAAAASKALQYRDAVPTPLGKTKDVK